MRTALATLVIAACFTITCGTALAQERPVQLEALPQPSRDVVSAWLQRDCSVGASQEEVMQLRALSGLAEEALTEAYSQGPPPELERVYQSAFSNAFDAREGVLAREGARLFGTEDSASLQAVDRETYIRRRLDRARINYRTNAVLGLGVVRARGALPLLRQIAADVDNPIREAALTSIEALKK
jgi:hypothetical protein